MCVCGGGLGGMCVFVVCLHELVNMCVFFNASVSECVCLPACVRVSIFGCVSLSDLNVPVCDLCF